MMIFSSFKHGNERKLTFLSLLCSFSAKGKSFLIQSKSYKMKYIY